MDTESLNDLEKVVLFTNLFRGRQTIVPRYWENKKARGYSPICRNEWVDGVCIKPCRSCLNADYDPLSKEMMTDHFKGKHIIGIYPLFSDGTCMFIAADFDNHEGDKDPLRDVEEFYEVCQCKGVHCHILRSKSGNGYHGFIFFSHLIPAWKARMVTFSLLKEAQVIGEDVELSSFDRLFPNQDKPTGKGFGNLIALPFQGQARLKAHTLFLNPDTEFKEPYRDQWQRLHSIFKNERLSEAPLDSLIDKWELKKPTSPIQSTLENNSDRAVEIVTRCGFLKWCRDNPSEVSEPLWYAMVSNLASIRPGGTALCNELSKGYPKYSREETDNKILHALNDSGPHTCQYIREHGFLCTHNCETKSPAGLLFKNKKPGDPQNVNPKKRIKVTLV